MRSPNWSLIIILAALVGVIVGYVYTLIAKPQLLPPVLRFGSLHEPMTVLVLGTDVVYSDRGRRLKADKDAFTGRSDTIMVCRLDPYRNSLGVLSIPRDTQVRIPGYGTQKINAANALGGPYLAQTTVSQFLGIPIDHYIVLNVHGLVDLVNELGGITVDIPKKMQYMDWTAKLKIDLAPGVHTLTGNQAMGFVRFRHDALGDIGRVQRQELFMRAVLDRAMQPASWGHIPKLMEIAQNYINTDMNTGDLMMLAQYARGVPKANQFMAMMPGTFSGSGDWDVSKSDVRKMVARLTGSAFVTAEKDEMRIAVENASATKGLGQKLANLLRDRGYRHVFVRASNDERPVSLKRTKIIAQRGNPEDAEIVKADLRSHGDIVTASVGDIESSITIMVGDDLAPELAD
ncbi:MAG: LCP family protein [Candidatus Melainabacteria bacterium]|nr:LCP family protein [Candidatus Melainabacteria bacterium]